MTGTSLYIVQLWPFCAREKMGAEDKADFYKINGCHHFYATSKEYALQQFHESVAIECLDDWNIEARRYPVKNESTANRWRKKA